MHPSTAQGLNNLADLYDRQGRYEEAEPLFQQALTIREQVLGEAHPDTAQSVWRLAVISRRQRHYQEAMSLYQRALSIYKQTLGETHLRTQSLQRDYISLLRAMGHEG
jgi:tetratricopeptide (TPR) repeat protein